RCCLPTPSRRGPWRLTRLSPPGRMAAAVPPRRPAFPAPACGVPALCGSLLTLSPLAARQQHPKRPDEVFVRGNDRRQEIKVVPQGEQLLIRRRGGQAGRGPRQEVLAGAGAAAAHHPGKLTDRPEDLLVAGLQKVRPDFFLEGIHCGT